MADGAGRITTGSRAGAVLLRFLREHWPPAQVEGLLARIKLADHDFASVDARMTVGQLTALWQAAASVEPAIGLLLHRRFGPADVHFINHLNAHADTLRAGFELWARFAPLLCDGDSVALTFEGAQAVLTYRNPLAPQAARFMVEHYFTMACAFAIEHAEGPLSLDAVAFEHETPPYAAVCAALFPAPVRYGAARNALIFPAADIGRRLRSPDPYLRGFLELAGEARLKAVAADRSPAHGLAAALRAGILRGDLLGLDEVAAAAVMTPADVRAFLAAQDTTWRAFADGVRRDLAGELIGQGMSATQAAYMMGYSEPAAFQHAFRRWYGVTVGAFRRAAVGAAAPIE
ncbi:helix-turn-helix domain-containing protein [Oleomonas cavernae]|uniref:Helix-turn-helix domain-containing protein n=1 Tax=Oleomonas cavernae TaxID=2320859 RepID=A0A418WSX6_9PROT|nr:AraC family transcriptional regulator ligand-binding domain-containing protein [Oleomonas cavernae]RJF94363.1 helix-turn-helix domain-containing protein [Oleomonas cavernae]